MSKRSSALPARILLLVPMHRAAGRDMLGGIARYAREYTAWDFLNSNPLVGSGEIPFGWRGEGILGDIAQAELAEQVRALGVPVVNLRDKYGLPAVTIDHRHAAGLAVTHLRELGLRHFAYYFRREMSQDIAEVFEQHLAGASLASRHAYIYRLKAKTPRSGVAHERAFRRWLAGLPKPVGLYAQDDVAAWQVVHACQGLGLRIPDDVALVSGSYDEFLCEFFSPSLSSVMKPHETQGYEAARLLDHLLRGAAPPPEPITLAATGVIARQSSDILATDEPRVVHAVRQIRSADLKTLQIGEVVREAELSRNALDNLFHKTLGHSVAEEIRRVRLERVKRQLMTTRHDLETIAADAGFNNAQYMSACFRRAVGISPGAFRRRGDFG